MNLDDAILIDARFGNCPVAIAEAVLGGKPKAKRPAKTWQWQDCKDLAKVLNEDWEPKLKITLGRNAILFADGSSFELGKRYGYRNASQCYEALLSLQSDRLARRSDAEAIAQAEQAKQQLL
jgi:hypothetical protein